MFLSHPFLKGGYEHREVRGRALSGTSAESNAGAIAEEGFVFTPPFLKGGWEGFSGHCKQHEAITYLLQMYFQPIDCSFQILDNTHHY